MPVHHKLSETAQTVYPLSLTIHKRPLSGRDNGSASELPGFCNMNMGISVQCLTYTSGYEELEAQRPMGKEVQYKRSSIALILEL